MAPELAVRRPRDEAEYRAALALRHDVFCDEQGVSDGDEIDGRDAEALHSSPSRGGRVVGTCRLLVEDGLGKLGRMAVERGSRRARASAPACSTRPRRRRARPGRAG